MDENTEEKNVVSPPPGSTARVELSGNGNTDELVELRSQVEQQREQISNLCAAFADLKSLLVSNVPALAAAPKKQEPTEIGHPAAVCESPAGISREGPCYVVKEDLPTPKLRPFTGNPQEYFGFIRQFEIYVEGKTRDPGKRLLQLHEHCTGRPQLIIRACLGMDPESGYRRARELLASKYGRPNEIFHCLTADLLQKCVKIRDEANALDDLAFHMSECHETANGLGKGEELNSGLLLGSIVKGFPLQMSVDWATKAGDIWEEGKEPTYGDLMEFISKRARRASSYFGRISENLQQSHRGFSSKSDGPSKEQTRTVFATSSSEGGCPLCSEVH